MLKYVQDHNTFGPPAAGSTGGALNRGTSPISDTFTQPSRIAVARLTKIIGSSAGKRFPFSFLGQSHQYCAGESGGVDGALQPVHPIPARGQTKDSLAPNGPETGSTAPGTSQRLDFRAVEQR